MAAAIAVEDIKAGKWPGLLSNTSILLMEAVYMFLLSMCNNFLFDQHLNHIMRRDLGGSTVIIQALPLTGYCEQERKVLGIVGGAFSSVCMLICLVFENFGC